MTPRTVQQQLLFLLLLVFGLGANSADSSELASGTIQVRIVNFEKVLEYELAPPAYTKMLTGESSRSSKSASTDPLKILHGELERKTKERRRLASEIQNTRPQIKWAERSPDGNYVVAGVEDPISTVITSASVYRMPDWKLMGDIVLNGFLRDVLWLLNSGSVAILDGTERFSLSPTYWIRSLMGHPVPIHTCTLTLLDLPAFAARKVTIIQDFPHASALLMMRGQ